MKQTTSHKPPTARSQDIYQMTSEAQTSRWLARRVSEANKKYLSLNARGCGADLEEGVLLIPVT
ncbi:hypothetical protein [Alcanivorax quisquiliarum]|uniref:Uncharacterized protein n=1 Tax=Alcanivorax quisquiliarum TaxID=2933565 RepID=A0ABT0E4J1_9GAMM|nr:hypothetical protein [Alcanivorax quisquiliarum]MCK0536547.1 hypothetical protein [Alcanivorax quisquiliarum]